MFMSMSMSIDIYIEMPDCPGSGQSGTGLKKLMMPKPVRYQTKLTQSGIFLVRYRTKIQDAGMLMPALVSSMPMPSYAYNRDLSCLAICSEIADGRSSTRAQLLISDK